MEKTSAHAKKKLFEFIADEEETLPKVRPAKHRSSKKNVLLIHSDLFLIQGLKRIFEKENISILAAESGESALKLISSLNFALIIMDINPTSDGMTGVYIYKCIQKKSPGLSEKMLFVSNNTPHASFQNFLKTNNARFFNKPLENPGLIDHIRKLAAM
ncbi:MAG: response regulator [Vulcanimicrobiota bacterium]